MCPEVESSPSLSLDLTHCVSFLGGGERESKTLIVNNLSYAASEETLQELFKKATSIKMPQNNQGRPKGYVYN